MEVEGRKHDPKRPLGEKLAKDLDERFSRGRADFYANTTLNKFPQLLNGSRYRQTD
jgi:hypothetical protein